MIFVSVSFPQMFTRARLSLGPSPSTHFSHLQWPFPILLTCIGRLTDSHHSMRRECVLASHEYVCECVFACVCARVSLIISLLISLIIDVPLPRLMYKKNTEGGGGKFTGHTCATGCKIQSHTLKFWSQNATIWSQYRSDIFDILPRPSGKTRRR